jgi:4-amino-4-deoxy-L-arabinose transferase-like glycosyltransferase
MRQAVLLAAHLLLPVLFALALLLRLFRLDAQSLWLDEGSTWQMLQADWSVLLADLFSNAAAYPLYHLLLKVWVLLVGDSEWALRLPSALAGAGAVVAVFAVAREMQRLDGWDMLDGHAEFRPGMLWFPLAAAVLLLVSPFAIWYAQEAKVYSLLLLVAALLLWALLRALRLQSWRAWLLVAAVAFVSVFVHRLAVLLLVAVGAAWLLVAVGSPARRDGWRQIAPVVGGWLALAATGVGVVTAMVSGLGDDAIAPGATIPAGPLLALRLTFIRFSVDRWPDEFPLWWLLPWLVLALWGGALLLRDSVKRRRSALVLLCFLLVPAGLFLAQLAFTRLYEARYLMLVYPAWLLLLAYPLTRVQNTNGSFRQGGQRAHLIAGGYAACLGGALLVSLLALVQPEKGIFSGDPVKEQYREALEIVARRMHPDDAIILHPPYLRPLYDYYMQRLTADPPPEPITFPAFKHRQQHFNERDWNQARQERLAGYVRSFLIVAPDHARTVDPILVQGDEYGLVGLYYRFSREQHKWPCGIWRPNGIHVYCQDSPEAYVTGERPQPRTTQQARFGERILLEGYTLKATTPAGPGVYRAGGTLPITLFWDVAQQPQTDYSVFLHLCRDCSLPPLASTDGPPLEGYLPTSTWLPRKPVHDERAIPLPHDLSPGRYTLLLGVYRPGEAGEAARLSVQGEQTLPSNRLVLGTVEIVAPDG